jgi:nicotinamidase-related amidase
MSPVSRAPSAVARVGWVVDVQNDFMRPDGRLYVHDLFDASDAGATQATDAIVRTVRWMRDHCDVVVFTGDWHGYGDREIDTVAPDATKGTYPPHCMGRSPDENEREGAAVIAEIRPGDDVLTLAADTSDETAREIARRAVHERRPVFIQKTEFSVFEGNRSANVFVQTLVAALGGQVEFVVCGVATDVCVRHAVEGMLDRELHVRVVPDATWSLGLLPAAQTVDAWSARGAARTLSTRLDEVS